jgi:hypothetical protein
VLVPQSYSGRGNDFSLRHFSIHNGSKTDLVSYTKSLPRALSLSLSLSLFPVAPTLEHRASVKRFVSLQFLNPKIVDRTPWTGDQPVTRPFPIQTQNKHTQISMP